MGHCFSFNNFFEFLQCIAKDNINNRVTIVYIKSILCSDTSPQIMPLSRENVLRHYGGKLKPAINQEAGEKINRKR